MKYFGLIGDILISKRKSLSILSLSLTLVLVLFALPKAGVASPKNPLSAKQYAALNEKLYLLSVRLSSLQSGGKKPPSTMTVVAPSTVPTYSKTAQMQFSNLAKQYNAIAGQLGKPITSQSISTPIGRTRATSISTPIGRTMN